MDSLSSSSANQLSIFGLWPLAVRISTQRQQQRAHTGTSMPGRTDFFYGTRRILRLAVTSVRFVQASKWRPSEVAGSGGGRSRQKIRQLGSQAFKQIGKRQASVGVLTCCKRRLEKLKRVIGAMLAKRRRSPKPCFQMARRWRYKRDCS